MVGTKWFSAALMLSLSLAWLVATPADVRAEDRPLHADDDTCLNESSVVGSTTILDKSVSKVKVKVKISDRAAAKQVFDIFWVCTTIQNGCHAQACGFVDIGDLKTNASGKGSRTITLKAGNPFPGNFVHVDLISKTTGALYDSTFESLFQSAPSTTTSGAAGVMSGDPTQ